MPASRWSRIALALATVLVVLAAADLRAQELRLPAKIGSFSMADSSRFEERALGIMYTYRDPAQHPAGSAYVYPVPAERLALPAEQQVALEAESFVGNLRDAVADGLYSAFNIPVSEARSWDTADGPRPGHLTVAAIRRPEGVFVSFMHLVLMGDHYVKTRLTIPADELDTSKAPNFGVDLFQLLTAPASTAP